MGIEKVTRKILREMRIGQTRIFALEHPRKAHQAAVTCNQLKREEGLVYEVHPDYHNCAVCIKRIN